jgi:hypothetical protein
VQLSHPGYEASSSILPFDKDAARRALHLAMSREPDRTMWHGREVTRVYRLWQEANGGYFRSRAVAGCLRNHRPRGVASYACSA